MPQAYQSLFENASRQSVFLSLPWFQNFEETILEQGEESLIYGVQKEGEEPTPLAALVLRSNSQNQGLFSPAMLEGLSNYYSSHFGPAIADDGTIVEAAGALTDALWRDRQNWDVINLRPLDPQSPIFTALIKSFRDLGVAVQTYFCFGNWYLDVAGRSYAEYFQTLPKALRKNIPYETRKLEKTGCVRVEMVKNLTGLERALDDYEKVYNTSWRLPEASPTFIRGLARMAATNGWLRLGILYLNDEPAAAQLWIVHSSVASIYKICYREKFANLSVGKILTTRMMQQAIDVDKVREVDYLSGDDAYKKDWMSHRRERWGIMAFNLRKIRGLSQAIRHIGGRRVKRTFITLRDCIRESA